MPRLHRDSPSYLISTGPAGLVLISCLLIEGFDGNLNGTTGLGGANNEGTIFKITPEGTLTTLYNFCSQTNCDDGKEPLAGLIQATDGNLYGTTLFGGTYGAGTVFSITPSGILATLHSFDGQ